MKEAFKKTVISVICSSIIAFIIGLVMVIKPDLSLQTIGIIVGIYFIIHGIILVMLDFKAHKYYIPFDGIMSGILSIILGILLIAVPNTLSIALTLALGVWILLFSVNIMKLALVVRKVASNWLLLFLLGIFDLIAGIIILFNPFVSSLSITVLAGIIIMAHSIINIIDMVVIEKNVKDFTSAIENNIKKIFK